MEFDKERLGYAFEGDYPESYGEQDAARLRAILPQQIGQLGAGTAEADARLLGILIGRRSSGDLARAQIETRPRRDGSISLLARGEVVVPASSYDPAHFADFPAAADPTGGRTKHVCLRRPHANSADIDRVIDRCGASRVQAFPNYLATMAAVGKGLGGPEPTPPPPPPPVEKAAGTPIPVAVIDTGIAPAAVANSALASIERNPDNLDELDVLPAGPDGLLDYQAGHGTFVAGVVHRVAGPAAKISVYKAADSDGFATDHDIAEAILRAHHDGAKIINLSLGIRTVDDQPPPAIAAAVAQVARDSGGETVIVAAAGNHGDETHVWPAALEGVESVAGLTAHLTPSTWSSYGDKVRFSTVAEGIRSTYVTGAESPVFDPSPDTFGDDAWAFWSGTSFAAPQIAGAIARISYAEGMEPRKAVDLLDEYGKQVAGYGKAMRILQGLG